MTPAEILSLSAMPPPNPSYPPGPYRFLNREYLVYEIDPLRVDRDARQFGLWVLSRIRSGDPLSVAR